MDVCHRSDVMDSADDEQFFIFADMIEEISLVFSRDPYVVVFFSFFFFSTFSHTMYLLIVLGCDIFFSFCLCLVLAICCALDFDSLCPLFCCIVHPFTLSWLIDNASLSTNTAPISLTFPPRRTANNNNEQHQSFAIFSSFCLLFAWSALNYLPAFISAHCCFVAFFAFLLFQSSTTFA